MIVCVISWALIKEIASLCCMPWNGVTKRCVCVYVYTRAHTGTQSHPILCSPMDYIIAHQAPLSIHFQEY